jgi:hypothetical protein
MRDTVDSGRRISEDNGRAKQVVGGRRPGANGHVLNHTRQGCPKGGLSAVFVVRNPGHRRDQCSLLTGNTKPKLQWVDEIPEVDPGTTGKPLNYDLLVGDPERNSFLRKKWRTNSTGFWLTGASLSQIKPGVRGRFDPLTRPQERSPVQN